MVTLTPATLAKVKQNPKPIKGHLISSTNWPKHYFQCQHCHQDEVVPIVILLPGEAYFWVYRAHPYSSQVLKGRPKQPQVRGLLRNCHTPEYHITARMKDLYLKAGLRNTNRNPQIPPGSSTQPCTLDLLKTLECVLRLYKTERAQAQT